MHITYTTVGNFELPNLVTDAQPKALSASTDGGASVI